MEGGTYFVTASTLHRHRTFDTPVKLTVVTDLLHETAASEGWRLRAWAVFSNHYHALAESPAATGESLRAWLREFHRSSAAAINRLRGTPGERVWMNFRESRITHERSLLARLR